MKCPFCQEEIPTKKVNDPQRGWYRASTLPYLKKLVPQWQPLTLDELHSVLKQEFNGFEAMGLDGKVTVYGQSVSKNTTNNKVFEQYTLRIKEWVRENYGLELPEPQ